MVVFTSKHVGAFNVNFKANLKLFLRPFNCASVGGKNFDNYEGARYGRENEYILVVNRNVGVAGRIQMCKYYFTICTVYLLLFCSMTNNAQLIDK